ncbi:uncharacterized protein si:ch211-165g14.1 [Boleophthalmus pectinirostris]|uniref:uncharacterized protein si:ch211-165g14.1 n=1 Tax=Boleophthalmus pectinirostris TaxID=150288 RepID=UPI00242C4FC8|nr:uncharacterized protein si:ch211-165g14.1 [Boleophthalmus pectinirostris]
MDVSSRGLPPLLMDLSKGFSVGRLPHSHAQPLDMTKKPEWYHRQPQSCGPDLSSPYRTSSLRPDLNQEAANYMNSPLNPGLDLYHDQVHNNLWHRGFYNASGNAGPESSGVEEEEEEEEEDSDSDSDVIFLVSSAKEPLLCTTFIQDNVTHIVEPLSPSSLDDRRSCYDLPQSSPSRDSSYTEESSDSSVDIPVHHARPIVVLSDLNAVYADQSLADASSDDSDASEVSKKKFVKRVNENEMQTRPKVQRSCSVRKPSSTTPPLTPRRSLRRQVKNSAIGLYNESYDSDDVLDFVARVSSSDESIPQQKNAQRMSCSKESKSNIDATTQDDPPSEKEEPLQCKSVVTKRTDNNNRRGKIAKKLSVAKQNCKEPIEKSQIKRTIKKRKRKRKFQQNSQSSLFTIDPKIALKYAYRKKREPKFDSFSPFIHIEKETCTVVNYHEEETAQKKPVPSQNVSGFVPTTSCYSLGRVNPDSKRTEYLKCCLCGQTANAKMLGDLHGPYYPVFSDGQNPRTAQNGHVEEEGSEFQNKSIKEEDALVNETLNLEECWMHEDCGVWSTGVFLVRGKLYGLKEAALLAQQTTCWLCEESGAIVGCFQRGCCRSFHVSCAVQSGCVLNEDNFSMRCPDHKNKPCVSRQPLR